MVGRIEQRGDHIVRAALAFGQHAVASHASAAQVLGLELLDEPVAVHVTVPRNHRREALAGVRLHRRDVPARSIRTVGILPVTEPNYTALDLAALLPHQAAVITLDSGLRLRSVRRTDLVAELGTRSTWPTRPAMQAAVAAADGRSESPPESIARLLFLQAGLPVIPQYEVFDDGSWIARVDFALEAIRTALEIDGFRWHSSPEAFQADHDREMALRMAGWSVLRISADDVLTRPQTVLANVQRALESEAARRYTPPPPRRRRKVEPRRIPAGVVCAD